MMNLSAIVLYGLINVTMVGYYLCGKGRFYQFPFWAGIIALGWFMPQAIGGYLNASQFPETAYAAGLFFATLCTGALWVGFSRAAKREPSRTSWLDAPFDISRLCVVGAILCTFGFFFQWKLMQLPSEITAMSQWSGVAVKYLFLASVFEFGFLVLWLVYLVHHKLIIPRLLIFIVPSLLLLLNAAILHGRRAVMMSLVSYFAVSLWLVRRISIPRWLLILGLALGLVLINSIGIYRAIIEDEERAFSDRLSSVAKIDFLAATENELKESGAEFKNYIFYRRVYADVKKYDYGFSHWNQQVFNYVPAQIVGSELKEALMLPLFIPFDLAEEKYGHVFGLGSTTTGYCDAFGSFGWLGFALFFLVGWLMGILYRHAMCGTLLGQLLYVYMLPKAMHAVTHGTDDILVRAWIYFFILAYPLLYWAKSKHLAVECGKEN